MNPYFHGISKQNLDDMLAGGVDDAGALIIPFEDTEGGWPLRCCLTDSQRGERIAIVGHSPFTWISPYRETGPIVAHTEGCAGHDGSFPTQFEDRDQVIKAFGDDAGRVDTQVYSLNAVVPAATGLERAIRDALSDPRVREVHIHNVLSQCFNFKAVCQ